MKVEISKANYLNGEIEISGSKNSCLPILAICLLTKKKMILTNVPNITDVNNMLIILKHLGVKVKREKDKVILKKEKLINNLNINEYTKIRASYYLIPGLINKFKKVILDYPGGCNFASRPIDYHLMFLKKSNIEIKVDNEKIILNKNKLKNTILEFPKPTVGATINAILHYINIKGKTIIKNQPIEPEIKDVIECLNMMNASIKIVDNNIIINGGRKLKGLTYKIKPDRIELGSYLLLACTRKSNVILSNILQESYQYLTPTLDKLGINYIYNKNKLYINSNGYINSIDLIVNTYPFFPTDLQPIICACLLNANGTSDIEDLVYPKRISHIRQMNILGGNISYTNGKIKVMTSLLDGKEVCAKDLRCGFALIICAVNANGKTLINNFEIVNRGYENIVNKLRSLNIQIDEY